MIVWVFAGGGQSEISGLLPYLRREFPNCDFQRVTPVSNKEGIKPNKLGAKPKTDRASQGLTGKSLLKEIEERLNHLTFHGIFKRWTRMGFQVKGTDGVKVVKSKQKQARKK